MSPLVLILTHPDDVHADAVVEHLHANRVQVCRVDTADLGTDRAPVTARLWGGLVTGCLAGCDLAAVTGVWHRRPSEFTTPDPVQAAELRAGVTGVLAGLAYLNHPVAMAAAAFKPYQLTLAARCGLRVPDTLVSTVRTEAQAHAARLGGAVVVKPMARHARLRLVTAADRTGWDRVMHLTQQRITTGRHVRLTAVDATLFAAEITSPHLDWRQDPDACTYRPVATPRVVAGPVRQLLRLLRLRYAALDFAVDDHDRWWFLEVNPNGQWLWIEHATGLPIAAAVAAALARTTPRRRAPAVWS